MYRLQDFAWVHVPSDSGFLATRGVGIFIQYSDTTTKSVILCTFLV